MSNKVTGKITEIGEPKILDNGAKTLEYELDNGEQYNNLYFLNYYCGADKLEYLDKFLQFNKVGDTVEVEYNTRCIKGVSKKTGNPYKMTTLNHFRATSVSDSPSYPQATPEPQIGDNKVVDDLPF